MGMNCRNMGDSFTITRFPQQDQPPSLIISHFFIPVTLSSPAVWGQGRWRLQSGQRPGSLSPSVPWVFQTKQVRNSSITPPFPTPGHMGPTPAHRTPRNCGCSPGALHSLSILSESMWAMEMTVAATYHGSPMREQTAMRMPTQKRSRWYP